MDITKMTGEELAEILTGQFTQLIQAQNNIKAIQDELARRKSQKAPVTETK